MSNLIEALNIFLKYGNPDYPTHCEHDVLLVMIDPKLVSEEDLQQLAALEFFPGEEYSEYGTDCFYSFYYGSC
jgi:hypothetical protein